MQPEPGKADIDRQRPLDLGAAVIEELRLVGDRRRHPVADHVHGYRPLEQETEMEQVHAEGPAGAAEQRPVGPEADIPIGVEIELGQRGREGRHRRVVGDGGEVPRSAHHVLEAEWVGGRSRGTLAKGGTGHCHGGQALQEAAARQLNHDQTLREWAARGHS